MTAVQAAMVAGRRGQTYLNHVPQRWPSEHLLREARQIFANTHLPMTWTLLVSRDAGAGATSCIFFQVDIRLEPAVTDLRHEVEGLDPYPAIK